MNDFNYDYKKWVYYIPTPIVLIILWTFLVPLGFIMESWKACSYVIQEAVVEQHNIIKHRKELKKKKNDVK